MDSDSSAFDTESGSEDDYEICCVEQSKCVLPFDPACIEDVILKICDKFDFRVIWNNRKFKRAVLVTAGLAVAGGIIGNHYGGKTGAALGGAVGGACGVGFVIVSIREVWEDIKHKLSEVFDVVYDYLAGLGFDDYKRAAFFLLKNGVCSKQLAMLILQISSDVLGQKILSSLTPA